MAGAKPVVSSDVGALREVVIDGESGYLLPPGDEDALTGALVRLFDDPALRQRLGSNGRRTVLERFTLARMVGRYAELYRRAVPGRMLRRTGERG